jgi:hypothetical protein
MQHKTSETGAEPADRVKPPCAVLCHQTVGRFRLRIAERRKDDAYFQQVREGLQRHASVLGVETTSLTGSVLVLHRGDSAEILSDAENADLFRVAPKEHQPPPIVHWLDALDRFDEDFLFPRMNEKPQRAAIGLFMLAVLQALRGSILPSAPSLLGEAMALLRKTRAERESDKT